MTADFLRAFIEVILAVTIAFLPFAALGFYRARKNGQGKSMGVGARQIQWLAVGMLIPAIVLLSLEHVIDSAVTGTLIGALAGYVLSHVGRFHNREVRKSESSGSGPTD